MTYAATALRFLTLIAALALVGSFAFAYAPIGVHADDMPTRDADKEPVEEVGVDVTCDGGFAVLFTAKDHGALGNVATDGYTYAELTKDALERVIASAAVRRLGVATETSGGLSIIVKDAERHDLMARTAERLGATGCTLYGPLDRGVGFAFVDTDGTRLRATFSTFGTDATIFVGR